MIDRSTGGFYGKYRGTVADNQDPSGLGRVCVKVPGLLPPEGRWAEPCVPYTGPGAGLFAIPPKNTGVWVEFEAGNLSRPIWVGCWWGKGQVPAQAAPPLKLLRTESGHTVLLDDTPNGEQVKVTSKHGATVVLDSAGVHITNRGQKVELTANSVIINGGALEVT